MNIVHIETRIVSVFGVVDENGDIKRVFVQPNPNAEDDPLLITKLNEESFTKAYQALSEVKCQLLRQHQ